MFCVLTEDISLTFPCLVQHLFVETPKGHRAAIHLEKKTAQKSSKTHLSYTQLPHSKRWHHIDLIKNLGMLSIPNPMKRSLIMMQEHPSVRFGIY